MFLYIAVDLFNCCGILMLHCYKIFGKYVSIGVTGIQSYEDTSQEFIDNMNRLFSRILGDISIIAPYAGKSRYVLLDDGIRLNVPFDKTFSCNTSSSNHCQFCTSCSDREIALRYVHNHHMT